MLNLLCAYATNAGLLPWNWSATRKKLYTAAEIRDGIATTLEEFEWAASHDAPARAHFSKPWGLFILRCDHYCHWINGWIGIGNHAHFLRSISYGSFLAFSTTLVMLFVWWRGLYKGRMIPFWIFVLVYLVQGSICAIQVVQQSLNVTANQTTFEVLRGLWKHQRNPYRKRCLSNWEEVCGSWKFFLFWLFPIPIPRVQDGFGYEKLEGNECQALLATSSFLEPVLGPFGPRRIG
jgi:hypothetical protein